MPGGMTSEVAALSLEHVWLVLLSVGVAIAIAAPAAVLIARRAEPAPVDDERREHSADGAQPGAVRVSAAASFHRGRRQANGHRRPYPLCAAPGLAQHGDRDPFRRSRRARLGSCFGNDRRGRSSGEWNCRSRFRRFSRASESQPSQRLARPPSQPRSEAAVWAFLCSAGSQWRIRRQSWPAPCPRR